MAHRMFCRRVLCAFLFLVILVVPCFAVSYETIYADGSILAVVPNFSDNTSDVFTVLAYGRYSPGNTFLYPFCPGVSVYHNQGSGLFTSSSSIPDEQFTSSMSYYFYGLNDSNALNPANASVTLPSSTYSLSQGRWALYIGMSASLPNTTYLNWTMTGVSSPSFTSSNGMVDFNGVSSSVSNRWWRQSFSVDAGNLDSRPTTSSFAYTCSSDHYLTQVSFVNVTSYGDYADQILDAIESLASTMHSDIASLHSALQAFASQNHTDLAAILAAFNREFPASSGLTAKDLLQAILTALTTDSTGSADSLGSAVSDYNSTASTAESIEGSIYRQTDSGLQRLDDYLADAYTQWVDTLGFDSSRTVYSSLSQKIFKALGRWGSVIALALFIKVTFSLFGVHSNSTERPSLASQVSLWRSRRPRR